VSTRAQALHEQSLALFRDLGERRGVAESLASLGTAALNRGDLAAAQAWLQEAVPHLRELGAKDSAAIAISYLGFIALVQGDLPRAEALFRGGLAVFWELGDRQAVAFLLTGFGMLAARGDQAERAARLLGASAALCEALGTPLDPVIRAPHDQAVAAARAVLGEPRFAQGWAAGRALALAEAVAEALGPLHGGAQPAPATPARPVAAGSAEPLTPREREVLRLLAAGRSNQQIGADLVLSVRTVEHHIANLYAKLTVRGRAEATAYALRHGLAQPS
jgi:ATP/maltotriose-dependent transcriptional regulator MalT